jgi:hypothetical protein
MEGRVGRSGKKVISDGAGQMGCVRGCCGTGRKSSNFQRGVGESGLEERN